MNNEHKQHNEAHTQEHGLACYGLDQLVLHLRSCKLKNLRIASLRVEGYKGILGQIIHQV